MRVWKKDELSLEDFSIVGVVYRHAPHRPSFILKEDRIIKKMRIAERTDLMFEAFPHLAVVQKLRAAAQAVYLFLGKLVAVWVHR